MSRHEPMLLVVGMDGGRWQSREKDPQTQGRWKEDKVCNVSTYIPGDGSDAADARKPQPLVTTCVATARDASAFGPMARLEAERRGLRQAQVVIGMDDGGNWIDPIFDGQFRLHARIVDWCHASQHVWDCAKAAFGPDTPEAAIGPLLVRAQTELDAMLPARLEKTAYRAADRIGEPRAAPRSLLATECAGAGAVAAIQD